MASRPQRHVPTAKNVSTNSENTISQVLTPFGTVKSRVRHFHKLSSQANSSEYTGFTKQQRMQASID